MRSFIVFSTAVASRPRLQKDLGFFVGGHTMEGIEGEDCRR